MLYGATTNAGIVQSDIDVARAANFQAFKLMWHSSDEDVQALKDAGITTFVVRLQDSYTKERGFLEPQQYVDLILPTLLHFYDLGARWFQVDNEVNVEGSWDTFTHGPTQYAMFMRSVMYLLRPGDHVPLIPAGAKLISPPLCFAPKYWNHNADNPTPFTLDEWFAAFMQTNFGSQKLKSLFQLFDAAGSNVYWQSERQLVDPSFGCSYDVVHNKSGMPVVVVEFGASFNWVYTPPPNPVQKYTPEQIHQMRVTQYEAWVRGAHEEDYVLIAVAFISPGGTPDWAGFAIDEDIARAMAKGIVQEHDPYPVPVSGGGTPKAL